MIGVVFNKWDFFISKKEGGRTAIKRDLQP